MKGSLLPIGTVVRLEGGTKKAMITGYYSKAESDTKIYTYNGCPFPEGFMENVFVLFDGPQIEEIIYKGLENDDFNNYKKEISGDTEFSTGRVRKEEPMVTNGVVKGRVPKQPTNPLSKSEMKSMYTKEVISGNQTNKFE